MCLMSREEGEERTFRTNSPQEMDFTFGFYFYSPVLVEMVVEMVVEMMDHTACEEINCTYMYVFIG